MALVTIRRSPSVQTPRKTDEEDKQSETIEDESGNRTSRSLNECYFANKGAALVLGGAERGCLERRSPARPQPQPQPDIQHHLQAMFYLLRPEETLKMAVKLESAHAGRTRYLVVVCRGEEAALLGIDCNERTTVGLVLRVLADTAIKLDGDGGFSVCVCNQQHIFKPVSVQAMWSALQTLHRASGRARELNHFPGGPSHTWCGYYESHVDSDRSCLNEWHAMDCIESRRPPSPDSLRLKPRQRDETESVIRCTLKEIMMSVDLDEVTSKAIRGRLEDELDMDLGEYKSFIDQEMLTILGQMDAPTEVFDHVYLGSEWNASNLEELQRNGVRHILNVTREIDNFFPGMFDYLNIRVYDDDKTDLLKHWDNTFKYINRARNEGSKVLVHCKMGISRSASVVIAYAMKAFNWNFDKAWKHVKNKRNCIKPNNNFLSQLETYQGILDAMKNKEKLQRSKSETNLKSPKNVSKAESKVLAPSPLVQARAGAGWGGWGAAGGGSRPRSWSPDSQLAASLLPPTSVSLENLASETRHMLMPCANGSYSVSPNQIIRLKEEGAPSVKHIVNEIESIAGSDRTARRAQRLAFGPPDPAPAPALVPPQPSPSRSSAHRSPQPNCEADGIHTWDPGERARSFSDSDDIVKSDSGIVDMKTKPSDALTNSVERVVDVEMGGEAEGRRSSSGSSERLARAERPERLAERVRPPPDIAANERKFNETCAILKELASAAGVAGRRGAATWGGRVWASAPADTWLRTGSRARRRLAAASHGDLPRAAPPALAPPAGAGLVSNLKKEFEARSEADARRAKSRARAAAATAMAAATAAAAQGSEPAEDVSVRVLVGRYDQPPRARCESTGEPRPPPAAPAPSPALCPAPAPPAPRRAPHHPLRNSFCGAGGGERPPLAPTVLALAPLDYSNVVVSTVMSKAQNKKQLQHGKTHPLTKLNINRSNNRCSNPVYNTM